MRSGPSLLGVGVPIPRSPDGCGQASLSLWQGLSLAAWYEVKTEQLSAAPGPPQDVQGAALIARF